MDEYKETNEKLEQIEASALEGNEQVEPLSACNENIDTVECSETPNTDSMEMSNCSCYSSCGSDYSRNGSCSCYTNCGSNYSK